jgi:dihydroflavonol-4-reductase
MTEEQTTLVTVTGASGFIALHCVRELLREGYRVRGTLRSLDKEPAIRAALALDDEAGARLSFVAANLLQDDRWPAAVAGAQYVLHVASPAPAAAPEHEDDLLRPARDGTLRVLRAAQAAGVIRVVMTSSIAAITRCAKRERGELLDEGDWSEINSELSAYDKSKTVAERAAWEFIEGLSGDRPMELVAMNPGYVLGPSLLGVDNASNELIRKLLSRDVPGVPYLYLPIVDVRDVALAHIAALRTPDAAGKRFILVSGACWYPALAKVVKAAGYKVPTWRLPNWLVRIVGRFDEAVALVAPRLGKLARLSNEQATALLDWHPRPLEESVLDTAKEIAARMS